MSSSAFPSGIATEIHFFCYDFKPTKEILDFDKLIQQSRPRVASYLQSFQSQFQQQRSDLLKEMSEFEKKDKYQSMDELEQKFRSYLELVKGLYNSCGLINPEDYMENQFPLQYLRYVATYKWGGSVCSNGGASGAAADMLGVNDAVYEFANMLYNLAAALQKSASMKLVASSFNDDSYKEAYQTFARVAGIYTYMKPLVSAINQNKPLLFDIQPQTLDALHTVALAHMQECAIQRLAMKEEKEGLIAKLCKDTSAKFLDARKHFEAFTSETWNSDNNNRFQQYLLIKEKYYIAMCYALHGKLRNATEDNGPAIYYERKALELLKPLEKEISKYDKKLDKAQTQRKKMMSSLHTQVTTFAKSKLETFEKENSMVFHAQIPSSMSEAFESQSVGKPSDFEEIMASPFFDLQFYDLFGQRKPTPGMVASSQMIAPPQKKKECTIQ